MNSLNVEQIQEIIPHRHPFLLLDRIEDYEPGTVCGGIQSSDIQRRFLPRTFSAEGSDAGRADP